MDVTDVNIPDQMEVSPVYVATGALVGRRPVQGAGALGVHVAVRGGVPAPAA